MLVSFHLIQNVIQELVTELVAFDVTKYPMKPYEGFFFFLTHSLRLFSPLWERGHVVRARRELRMP